MTTAQPAGFQSIEVGDARVSYLPDGHIHLEPEKMYPNREWDPAAHAGLLDSDGLLVMSMGTFLIEIDGQKAVVDLGLGDRRLDVEKLSGGLMRGEMVGGHFARQLASAGMSPADIDIVLITHLHDEHIGWLADPTADVPTLMFPRARHFVGRREWEVAIDPDAPPSPVAPTPEQMTLLTPKVELLDDGDQVIEGLTAMHTPGHTPGHMSFVVTSQGQRLIVIGDVVHSPVEFSDLELEFIGDADREGAQKTRATVLAELAAPNTITAGVHFPNSVFARWQPDSGSFTNERSAGDRRHANVAGQPIDPS